MKTLITRSLWGSTEYVLEQGALRVAEKKIFSGRESVITFENISFEKDERRMIQPVMLVLIMAGFALGLLGLYVGATAISDLKVMTIPAFPLALAFLFLARNLAVINQFRITAGNEQLRITVRDFQLNEARAFMGYFRNLWEETLREKYIRIDRKLPFDYQHNCLIWLKNLGVLSEYEFAQLEMRLFSQICRAREKIGFRFESQRVIYEREDVTRRIENPPVNKE